MTKYNANEVFTPTTQAQLTFIERESDINDELVESLMTPGKQLIIYGHSGTGKSTLIVNKLNQTYENVIISRCTSEAKFDELILDAFDQLDVYFDENTTKQTTKSIGVTIKKSYALIQGQIQASISSSSSVKSARIIPPQLTPQRLAQFLGASKNCWVIEDFHKLKPDEKTKFAQNMKVFVDTATEYPDVKMIAIGAVGTAREVVEYDKELNNRVSEIFVPPLSKNELHSILDKGEKLLNISFTQNIKNKIVEFSNGLGSICHQLALNLCFSKNIFITSEIKIHFNNSDLKTALEKFIKSNSDTLKGRFDKATKVQRERNFNNGRIILKAMTQLSKDVMNYNEILQNIQNTETTYPPGNLTQYLKKLQEDDRGSVITYNSDNNTYSFTDPFIKTYVQCVFDEKNNAHDSQETARQVTAIFERLMEKMIK
ncbi:MAG: hypothetical protein ACJAUD_000496 [Crocinitomicaceae bacterium]|jgi:hypothetical protein